MFIPFLLFKYFKVYKIPEDKGKHFTTWKFAEYTFVIIMPLTMANVFKQNTLLY